MRNLTIGFIVAAASILGWLYWRQSQAAPLIVSGFVETDEVRVGSRVGGRVVGLSVAEGQQVRVGDTLFTLDTFNWQERLAEARTVAVIFGERGFCNRK